MMDRYEMNLAAGWLPKPFPTDIYNIKINKDTLGLHRYIAYETGVLPYRVSLKHESDRLEEDTVVVEVRAADLKAEPLRVPPPKNSLDRRTAEQRAADKFPHRRARDLTKEEFEAMLDEFLYMPFEVVVIE